MKTQISYLLISAYLIACYAGIAAPASDSNAKNASPASVKENQTAQSGGVFSWIKDVFSVSPEERDAREAELRAKADNRSKELAAAIAAEKDAEEKARLQKEAEAHARKEQERRAEFEKRKADEKAKAKARAEEEARKAADQKAREKAREESLAKREAEQKTAEEAKLKARAEAKAKAEQDRKNRKATLAKQEAERKAAKEAALKARTEQEEKEQTQRVAALQAQLKAAEEARAKSETEAKAKAEQEKKIRVEAVTKSAAERKAKEEAKVKAELERQAEREKALRERMDARAKELEAAAAATKDQKEKEALQKQASVLAEKEAKRRAAFAESEAEIKARWDARAKVLDERAKRELEQAATRIVERSKWKISAGAMHRTINSQTFKSGSYSQSHPIPAKSGDKTYDFDPAGDTASFTERDYIDGYVHKDNWTDLDGGTWNWGYDSGAQIRNETLVLKWFEQSRTWFTRNTSVIPGEREKETDGNCGVYVRAERILKQAGPFDYGLRLDASRVSYSSSGDCTTFRDKQQWATYHQYAEDSYSLAGTGITSADTPYQGDINTPGPSINNTPDSRRSLPRQKVSSGSYEAYNAIDESLDLDFSTLSLGLSIAGNYHRAYVSGATGPTLTIADTDASYYEALYERNNGGAPSLLTSWRDTYRTTEYNMGFFVQGELGFKLIEGLALSIFGRYDWTENISGTVGQTRYVVNPEGGSVGGTVNYAF